MSFFQRSLVAPDAPTSFHPLFRLLDDFDQYSKSDGRQSHHRSSMKTPTFSPKFDVKEFTDVYELHGELPGIEQKDVEIEFTDHQTLTVKGHTERSFTRGNAPGGLVEGSSSSPSAGSITEPGEHDTSGKARQPTVEDENNDNITLNNTASGKSNNSKDNEVSKTGGKPSEPEAKYWVSERSVGDFSRSFTFPIRVDQDAVRASMKNGILSVIVPKAKKAESRKIAIS